MPSDGETPLPTLWILLFIKVLGVATEEFSTKLLFLFRKHFLAVNGANAALSQWTGNLTGKTGVGTFMPTKH